MALLCKWHACPLGSEIPSARRKLGADNAKNAYHNRYRHRGRRPAVAMAGKTSSGALTRRYHRKQAQPENIHTDHQHGGHKHRFVAGDLAVSHIPQVAVMIISANQPYFCPFPGFFYKIHLCDVFVILDRVQFPRGTTWLNRNRFKNDQGTLWVTLPVWRKGLGLQRIDEVKICHEGRWQRKHAESLRSAYAHAPYLEDHLGFVLEIFNSKFDKILDFNLKIIGYLVEFFNIETKIVLLSDLGLESKGSRLLTEVCQTLGGTRFLAQSAAAKYLDEEVFEGAGIEVEYFKYPTLIYPQLWGDFIPNLSAFDLIFNCGPKAKDILFGRT